MIHRSTDVAFFNAVSNHPSVRPFLGGPGGAGDLSPLDIGPVLAIPGVVALQTDHGGWIFVPLLAGAYELHTMMLPEGRGRAHLNGLREAFRYMFTQTDCVEILTKCPDDNGAARWASSHLGFRERFRRENAWAMGVGISYRAFTVDDWTARDPACLEAGQEFHKMLERAKAGTAAPLHDEDEAHDRQVGAAVLMARAGRMDKGVGLYNRWAAFAGYAPVEALSATVLDIVDAVVEIRPDGAMGAIVRPVSAP